MMKRCGFRSAVRAFLLACLLFSSVELGTRALGYHGSTFFQPDNSELVDDPIINWRYKPNTELYFNDVIYKINEQGFRDNIHPKEKPRNTLRIFVASDSVGFGTNVSSKDAYPSLLETKLNDRALVHTEVINYSLPGLSANQKLHLIQKYAASYSADIIVMDYVMEDIAFQSMKHLDQDGLRRCAIELVRLQIPCALKKLLTQSALLFFVKESVEKTLHKLNVENNSLSYQRVERDYFERLYQSEDNVAYLKQVFSELERYQDETSIPIIMPIFPLLYDYSRYKWGQTNNFIIRLCQKSRLTCVPLLGEYQKYDFNELRVQRGDFLHPSIKGNSVAADTIKSFVKNSSVWKALNSSTAATSEPMLLIGTSTP